MLTSNLVVYSSQSTYIYKSDIYSLKYLTGISAHKSAMTITVKAINSKEYALIQIILTGSWTCISLPWSKRNETSSKKSIFSFLCHLLEDYQ